ncbi:Tyrosine recombinase XerC [Brevundimonas subvibrioides]|uniref:tyrosine-type recombinase/integrase n=1 Tax=Brevundimonas subvibrioides TaxID=74313 RepID=UPI0032D58D81
MPVTSNPKTGKWVADYTDQFGKRHRHGFDTRKEAKDHLLVKESAIRDRTYKPDATKTKLAEVCHQFIEASRLRVQRREIELTTHDNYAASVSLYINASRALPDGTRFKFPLGQMAIGDIGEPDVEDFRGHIVDLGLKPQTVRGHMVVLGLVLGFAKKRKLITFNVTQGMRTPQSRDLEDDDDAVIPEKTTVLGLIEGASPPHRLLILFAATTGLRSSEQRALQWKHVDTDKRVILVRRRVDVNGKFGPPKTKKGKRRVPIPPILVDALVEHRSTLSHQGSEDLVFPSRRNTPLYHSNLLKSVWETAWKRLRARTDPMATPPEYVNWHCLRHFAISTWIEKKVDVKQVQEWAGHANASITLNTYSHVFRNSDQSHLIDEIAEDMWK